MPVLVKASVVLFVAAAVTILVLVGWVSLPVVALWALAAVGVAVVARLVTNSAARVALAALLVAGCVLFAVELGLYFVPAAVALLAAAIAGHRRRARGRPDAAPPDATLLHEGR